jgi:hypothetical protein
MRSRGRRSRRKGRRRRGRRDVRVRVRKGRWRFLMVLMICMDLIYLSNPSILAFLNYDLICHFHFF